LFKVLKYILNNIVISISFFKIRKGKRWWAFRNVPIARQLLKESNDILFSKFMGSGAGKGFSLWPDFNVYCLLIVFENNESVKQQVLLNPAHQLYANQSDAQYNVLMQCISAHGLWNNLQPFVSTKDNRLLPNQQVGVITRASIRKSLIWKFWQFVPAVSRQIGKNTEVLFSKGIGEVPLVEQATFSIWPNQEAIKKFAYRGENHAAAVKKTRELNWYSEELFVRFAIEETFGSNIEYFGSNLKADY